MTQGLLVIEVDSSGASVTIDPAEYIVPQVVWLTPLGGSPISFAAPWAIQFASDPDMGNQTIFRWKANDFDLNGQTMTVQGISLTQEQLNTNGQLDVITVDTSGTNNIVYTANISDDESIPGTALVIDSTPLNRLTGMTSAQIVLADSSNVPTATTVSGDATIDDSGVVTIANEAVTNAKLADLASGFIKVGNGSNRPADVQMSGDATMDNTGAVTIADGVITPQKLSFTTGVPIVAQINIESAAFQSGNTTPIIIIPAIGGATIIPIKAIFSYVDNGTPYTTNVNIGLLHRTATSYIATIANALDKTISYTSQFAFNTVLSGITDTQYVQGQDLLLQVDGGDAAAGDGTATVTVWFLTL